MCISNNSTTNTYKFKSSVEVYPIDVYPIEVYPIEAYLIGKGVVEVSGCHTSASKITNQQTLKLYKRMNSTVYYVVSVLTSVNLTVLFIISIIGCSDFDLFGKWRLLRQIRVPDLNLKTFLNHS